MAVTLHDHDTGPRRVSILGSTGSVGCNTVDLLRRAPDAYSVEALTARTNVDVLASQARELQPRMAVIADESLFGDLKDALAETLSSAGGCQLGSASVK